MNTCPSETRHKPDKPDIEEDTKGTNGTCWQSQEEIAPEMTQMPHHDAQVTSPPAGLPPGTKRVVTFDTNAYRNLNRNKVRDLRQRERETGVFALANPIVIQELAAHLVNERDDDYRHCVSGRGINAKGSVNQRKERQ
jgi:hypothetical protein